MTFKNEKECIENSLQVGIESPPKKIKLTITVKAEEDKK
jgi:ribosomal protein L31E